MPTENHTSEHEHNDDALFQQLLDEAEESRFRSNSNTSLSSDAQLSDKFYPEEEKNRERSISEILQYYKDSYKNKVSFQKKYRKVLFWGCSIIIIIFSISVLWVLAYSLCHISSFDISGIAALITALLSLIVSILKLAEVIAKYCFPKNDEDYIVKIIESIQTNDLAKIKESNRAAEARNKDSSSND